jgi:segregation and condensation protein B
LQTSFPEVTEEALAALEAVLFASGDPIELSRVASLLGMDDTGAESIVTRYAARLEERGGGLTLLRLGTKLQLATKPELGEYVRAALDAKRKMPLHPGAMEVLAVIAYHQPVTKSYVDKVRGTDCYHIISNLCQKGLVEEGGRLELPGRPLVYRTTDHFLRAFCLSSLDDLPPKTDPPKLTQAAEQLQIEET